MERACEGGTHPKEVIQGVMLLMSHLVPSPFLSVCSRASLCHEMSILFHIFPLTWCFGSLPGSESPELRTVGWNQWTVSKPPCPTKKKKSSFLRLSAQVFDHGDKRLTNTLIITTFFLASDLDWQEGLRESQQKMVGEYKANRMVTSVRCWKLRTDPLDHTVGSLWYLHKTTL